jgi:hypothetical protein
MQTWSVAVGSWPDPLPSQFEAVSHAVVAAPPSQVRVQVGAATVAAAEA